MQPTTLAEQFSTSTTVIRQSLTRLAGENLVTIRPNRGFFVPDLNLGELADITELRCVTRSSGREASPTERGTVSWESSLIAIHHKLSRHPLGGYPRNQIGWNPQWSQAHREFHHPLLAPCECQAGCSSFSGDLANFTELYRRWAAPSQAAVALDVEQEHADIS